MLNTLEKKNAGDPSKLLNCPKYAPFGHLTSSLPFGHDGYGKCSLRGFGEVLGLVHVLIGRETWPHHPHCHNLACSCRGCSPHRYCLWRHQHQSLWPFSWQIQAFRLQNSASDHGSCPHPFSKALLGVCHPLILTFVYQLLVGDTLSIGISSQQLQTFFDLFLFLFSCFMLQVDDTVLPNLEFHTIFFAWVRALS